MDAATLALLAGAGVGAGLAASIAGLASLFSYPALLGAGLPPLIANMTNTVSMLATTVGAAGGSRRELRGQGRRLGWIVLGAVIGGSGGAALLLTTPAETFELVVPWLIALGSLLLLARDRLRQAVELRAMKLGTEHTPGKGFVTAFGAVTVYSGYFGAGSGIMMLAVLSVSLPDPLPVSNALKNIATGAANATAAVAFAVFAPVHWPAAAALAAGSFVGAWLGPMVVRRLPERPLRIAIALAGLGLAAHLFVQAL
ncbi:transporter [Saccharomonospora sp. CUA-673]|uniref:sulfite exporter TauE/SafE family protein n=1 Tax=Saccharomonospora sp. CUA-673 TaxID=1904969 RepID=UPI00095FCA0C|nr:sulfite exporter TauE/SafE family protein [Saccharomonospora sp. CUA-673]OLT47833.1 transporter [Saccharomonospora sp. CUA-673]